MIKKKKKKFWKFLKLTLVLYSLAVDHKNYEHSADVGKYEYVYRLMKQKRKVAISISCIVLEMLESFLKIIPNNIKHPKFSYFPVC